MRAPLIACCALALLGEGLASADAHHQILSHGPIQDKAGEVIGFRASVLLDPQRLTSNHATFGGDVRLGLGGLKYDRTQANAANSNHHRDAVAGAAPGYVLHQLKMREITGPGATDRGPLVETMQTGGQAREVEVEVLYKDNPNLVPGSQVDLVAGFWKGSYWHVWGAVDSPTMSSRDFVLKLPGTPSKAFLQQQIDTLKAQLPHAQAAVTAAQQQVDAAQKAHATAQQAVTAATGQQQAPWAVLQQANQAASLAYSQATQGPQAAYNQAIQAARTAYQAAIAPAQAAYQAAINAAQARLRAVPGNPGGQLAYNQAVQAASASYQAATRNATTLQQQAFTQAQAVLNQATTAARAIYTQRTQAAQAAYSQANGAWQTHQAALNQHVMTLRNATTAKANADAALKALTDKLADYQQMLQAHGAQGAATASR